MEYKTIIDGGVQYFPVLPQKQIVYLDFDGEFTSYNGEILTIDGVEVQNSNLTADRIAAIVNQLNTDYVDKNVVFVTEKPISGEYSTVYIGKTDAFDQYGSFAGLAETIDGGNRNKTDKAFVMLDSSSNNPKIIETISHETDHLLGTLDHGGNGLNAYAVRLDYIMHINNRYESETNIHIYPGGRLYVYNGGTVSGTYINSGGELHVSSSGTANDTEI